MADPHHKRIGILGGAFNPAHDGHVFISQQAYTSLNLDEIWWIVSNDHPTKGTSHMPPCDQRINNARQFTAQQNFIHISDIELTHKTSFTFDTITLIKQLYPNDHFVLIIGADNLVTFHTWHRWEELFHLLPIVVVNRGDLKSSSLKSVSAQSFNRFLEAASPNIPTLEPPGWCFLDVVPHPASSSAIRSNQKN